jgi:hypothetical protein
MNDAAACEPAKARLADALFENGFSEDADHNWHLGCLMIEQPQFPDLCRRADNLKYYCANPAAMQSAKEGLQRDIAQMLYDASQGLPDPNVDHEANWRLAEQLRPVLAETLALLTETPQLAQCA